MFNDIENIKHNNVVAIQGMPKFEYLADSILTYTEYFDTVFRDSVINNLLYIFINKYTFYHKCEIMSQIQQTFQEKF